MSVVGAMSVPHVTQASFDGTDALVTGAQNKISLKTEQETMQLNNEGNSELGKRKTPQESADQSKELSGVGFEDRGERNVEREPPKMETMLALESKTPQPSKVATAKPAPSVPVKGQSTSPKRVRLTKKDASMNSFKEALIQHVSTNYYVKTENESLDTLPPQLLEGPLQNVFTSVLQAAKENIMKTWVGSQLEKQLDATFNKQYGIRKGVDSISKLLAALAPRTGVSDKIRNARVRTAELLYASARREDPVLNSLGDTPQLNSIGLLWIEDFIEKREWRAISQLLTFLDAIPMSTGSLKTNKDVARKVKELAKLSKREEVASATASELEEVGKIEVKAKKIMQKWMSYFTKGKARAENEKTAQTSDKLAKSSQIAPPSRVEKANDAKKQPGKSDTEAEDKSQTAASISKAASRPVAEVKKKRPMPSAEETTAPKRAKPLSDDDLFGFVQKKKMSEGVRIAKPRAADDVPAPSKYEEDAGRAAAGKAVQPSTSSAAVAEGPTKATQADGQQKTAAVVKSIPPQTAEGKKQKKRVTWAPAEQLQKIEYIETRDELARMFAYEPPPTSAPEANNAVEGEDGTSLQAQSNDMNAERQRMEKVAMYKKIDIMREEMKWYEPNRVKIPDELSEVQYQGAEAPIRAAIVSLSMEAFPVAKQDTSPEEAPFTPYASEDPVRIPLENEASNTTEEASKEQEADTGPENDRLTNSQREQLDYMKESVPWINPQRVAPGKGIVANYAGDEARVRDLVVNQVAEVFPGADAGSPEEADASNVTTDARMKIIPLQDADANASAQGNGEENRALALASVLRSAMDPTAETAPGIASSFLAGLNNLPADPVVAAAEQPENISQPSTMALQNLLHQLMSQQQAIAPGARPNMPVAPQFSGSMGAPVPAFQPMDFGAGVPPPVFNFPPLPPSGTVAQPPVPNMGMPLGQMNLPVQPPPRQPPSRTDQGQLGGRPNAGTGEGGTQYCAFYNTRAGCKNGDSCRFIHSEL